MHSLSLKDNKDLQGWLLSEGTRALVSCLRSDLEDVGKALRHAAKSRNAEDAAAASAQMEILESLISDLTISTDDADATVEDTFVHPNRRKRP